MTRTNSLPKIADTIRPNVIRGSYLPEKGLKHFLTGEIRGLVDDNGKPVQSCR
jgi:hypothetical protein